MGNLLNFSFFKTIHGELGLLVTLSFTFVVNRSFVCLMLFLAIDFGRQSEIGRDKASP